MDAWVAHGVGPWFYFENIVTDYFRHRGVDSPMRMSAAIANSGDLQIELIQQRNDAPSLYTEFLASGKEGFQHVSYWTTDIICERVYFDAATIAQQLFAEPADTTEAEAS